MVDDGPSWTGSCLYAINNVGLLRVNSNLWLIDWLKAYTNVGWICHVELSVGSPPILRLHNRHLQTERGGCFESSKFHVCLLSPPPWRWKRRSCLVLETDCAHSICCCYCRCCCCYCCCNEQYPKAVLPPCVSRLRVMNFNKTDVNTCLELVIPLQNSSSNDLRLEVMNEFLQVGRPFIHSNFIIWKIVKSAFPLKW